MKIHIFVQQITYGYVYNYLFVLAIALPQKVDFILRFVLIVEGNTKMYEILSIKTVSLTAIQKLKLRISTFVNKNKLYKVFYNLN